MAKLGIKRAQKPAIPRKHLISVGVVGRLDSSTAGTFSSVGPISYFDTRSPMRTTLYILLRVEGEVLLLQSLQHR